MKLPGILASKKGQAFLLGLLAVVLQHVFGLTPEDVTKVVGLVGAYVLGQGAADFGKGATEAEQPKG